VGPDGDVWAATPAGVVRLHGNQVTPVPTGLPENARLSIIHVDAKGRLWLGTGAGLFRRDGERLEQVSSTLTMGLADDPDGSMWVATASGAVHLGPSGPLATW